MSLTAPTQAKPLGGLRVLVPRGGPWGDSVASTLRSKGATPVIAPMTNFVPAPDTEDLTSALADLAAGKFDWVTLTSSTTVDVLSAYRATIPSRTRIAAVGETTASALAAIGYKADLTPGEQNTARGLLEAWESATGGVVPLRILTLRSQVAVPVLTDGLKRIGHDVRSVIAYRTVGVPIDQTVIDQVRRGDFTAVLVTSGSVAEEIAAQLGDIPRETFVLALGPRTATDARHAGVRVDATTPDGTVDSIVAALTSTFTSAQ
ncbi:MAG: uroporphyrinogen-III synthase [Microbacteriaceae bacterium]|nr:uroporphyrinogen-III synthase [Microbacteriaceae bacterium]